MNETRITGALVLAMGLAIMNIAPCQAQTVKQAIDGGNTEKSLTVLIDEAKAAQTYVSKHPSEKHPGLAKYLQKLIEYGEAGEIENEVELTKALEEVLAAVPLLVPEKKVSEVEAPSTKAVSISTSAKAEPRVETAIEDATESTEEKAAVSPEVAELPNTGEVRTAGMGEFILAGAVVLIGTVGATILILRSKKN